VSEQPVESPVSPSSTQRRPDWIVRGIFEAALILLGLLGGFALNEWQGARDRRERAAVVLSAIRSELEANRKLMEQAVTYNTEVVGRLRKLRDEGATEAPLGTYPQGLISSPTLTSAAWTSAEAGGVVSDLPVATGLALARVYETQRVYMDAMAELLNMLFASRLASTAPGRASIDPQRVTGILSDYAGRGRNLVGHYNAALKVLNETPQ
jgi:hypothetical protein